MASLVCTKSGERFPIDSPIWRSQCGGLLDIEMESEFDLDRIAARKPGMWRYRQAIPIESDESIVSMDEGFTPLVDACFEGRQVLAKLEFLFPTGSYKDRGASVLISKARELGVTRVVEDSSGNAGSAMAAYCARASIACDVYVPSSTSPGKLRPIEAYDATLHKVPGTREQTAKVATEAAEGIYYASHVWNPFFLHGTKTFAFEVAEQLGWQAPEAVIIPTGNGTLLLGAYIGFGELHRAGVIDRMPKLIAVQAAGCAPLYSGYVAGGELPGVVDPSPSVAEGIAIAAPARGRQCLSAIRDTGGSVMVVDEGEIVRAQRVACEAGFFIEATSAVAIAGVMKYEGDGERIVVPLTGSVLKSGRQ